MPTRNNTADNVNVNIHGIGRSITDWNKIAGMSDETKTGKKKKRKPVIKFYVVLKK